MKKYLVRFTTKSSGYDEKRCYANSEDEAVQNIQDKHWNIALVSEI